MTKHVLVLYTGGTISMVNTKQGMKVDSSVIQKQLETMPTLTRKGMPTYSLVVYDKPIDSSQISIDDWNKFAKIICDNYDKYDGFVILHGTDSLAYTGTALSFILQNIRKPVILTGAQRSINELITDARENVINALFIAGYGPIQEVCILFDRKLYRANRCTKTSTELYNAFSSPNYPLLGEIQASIRVYKPNLLKHIGNTPVNCTPFKKEKIVCLKYLPSMEPSTLIDVTKNAKALILITLGNGNLATTKETLAALKQIMNQGVVIINCTECLIGKVSPIYKMGDTLAKIGVIPAHDMTLEAVYCKLLHLYSHKLTVKQIKAAFHQNLCGEIDPDSKFQPSFFKPSIETNQHEIGRIVSSKTFQSKL